ncbi:MAG TPA: hypothetical protein VF738_04630 [Rhodanobacter sp.]
MKRMLFVLALFLPCAARAGLPMPQDAPAPSAGAGRHSHLFELKFVLRPAPAREGSPPRIQFDDQAPAVVPPSRGRQAYRRLGLPGPGPNAEICESWACEAFGQR